MKTIVFLMIAWMGFSFLPLNAAADHHELVLIEINGRTITQSEFEMVYRKNNLDIQVADPKSVEEYLELYINFNLKVLEAMSLGLDTNEAFLQELEGYREELAKPYLRDQEVSDRLMEEAYERLHYDIRASHILFSVAEHAPPEDTLEAYRRAMDVRGQLLEGASFEEMARQHSDDPSATGMEATANRPAMPGNDGDLGYFTVLNMVYPFESAAYNTPVGEITKPVRTSFGYHLIKVTDRLPAMGRVTVSHIMVNVPQGAEKDAQKEAKEKIEEIYDKIGEGEDFGSLASRFSDDRATAGRDGRLAPFSSNRMVPEFIKAISKLDDPGDVSQPLRTRYGWHIIKLAEKSKPEDFERMYAELKNRVSRDSRAKLSEEITVDRLKKEYDYRGNTTALEMFYDLVDASIFQARWEPEEDATLDEVLFTFDDKVFTQQDFASYLERNQSMRTPENLVSYVNTMYESFVSGEILAHEDARLEEKYPEFRVVMREYHDGILLFELTEQKVWNRAVEDTLGLKSFYRKNQSDYGWDERVDATIYTTHDRRTARATRRAARRANPSDGDYQEVLKAMNDDSRLKVSAQNGKFTIEDHPALEKVRWREGVARPVELDDKYAVVHIHQVLPEAPQQMNEIRGILIADYQNHLEKKWVEELRNKYDIFVDEELLEELSNKLNP